MGVWYLSQSEKAILFALSGRRFVIIRSAFEGLIDGRGGPLMLSEILPDGIHV